MTKVLFVGEQLRRSVPGGIGRYASCLLKALGDKSGEIDLFLFASSHRSGPDPLADFNISLQTSLLPQKLLTRAWRFKGVVNRAGLDILHSPSLAFPTSCDVVSVHDLAWRRTPTSTTSRGRRWHEKELLRAISTVPNFVVPSQDTKSDLIEAGVQVERITVIRHGADHLLAPNNTKADKILASFGVDLHRGFFLSVGTREPRKNLDRLAKAFETAYFSMDEPCPLLLVGPKGWGEVTTPGKHVIELGPVDDSVLSSLYLRATAFCYVPLAEGYGLPPIEAMALGTPVLVSTTVPSTTVEGDTTGEAPAVFVDPTTTDAIADGILCLAQNGDLRASLIEGGRRHVATQTWDKAASEHIDLWNKVAGKRQ